MWLSVVCILPIAFGDIVRADRLAGVGKKIPAFIAASVVQVAVLYWFNWVSCHMGVPDVDYFPGESRFVGGLGTVYAITFSMVGGLVAGGVACLLFRKRP